MDFSEHNPAVIAIAAHLCGYTKSVAINEDGSLEWFGEETHPSDSEMTAKLSASQTEYDTNGARTD
jgi:hypothetical protein